MSEAKVYYFENTQREVHMVGDYVGVCWNFEYQRIKQRNDFGQVRAILEIPKRIGEPYIDFVAFWGEEDGEFYEDEDSPVDGGFSLKLVPVLVKELQAAADYIQNLKEEEDAE